jgi:hypothetical protein
LTYDQLELRPALRERIDFVSQGSTVILKRGSKRSYDKHLTKEIIWIQICGPRQLVRAIQSPSSFLCGLCNEGSAEQIDW